MDRLYRVAEPQAGYFTTAQAGSLAVSRQELYYLRRRGDVIGVTYGIQRLARFPTSPHEGMMVACLWAGEDSVVSRGLRFAVAALLAGREFSAFRLDVNLVSDDRPVETVRIHQSLLASMGLGDLDVPMISVAQHLAEKLHAVSRTYATGDSSRAKDAFDTVVFAQSGALPEAGVLRKAVKETFTIRDTPIPAVAPSLPESWNDTLGSLGHISGLEGVEDVEGLERNWTSMWQPILDETIADDARWDVVSRSWQAP